MKRLALLAILGFSGVVHAQTTSYQDIGNMTFGSDGSTQQRIGNMTFITGGTTSDGGYKPSVTCQRIGSSTFCN